MGDREYQAFKSVQGSLRTITVANVEMHWGSVRDRNQGDKRQLQQSRYKFVGVWIWLDFGTVALYFAFWSWECVSQCEQTLTQGEP